MGLIQGTDDVTNNGLTAILSERFSGTDELRARIIVEDLSRRVNVEPVYLARQALTLPEGVEPHLHLEDYLVGQMMGAEDPAIKAKGYMIDGGYNPCDPFLVFYSEKHPESVFIVPQDLAAQYDIHSANSAARKLQGIRLPNTPRDFTVKLCLAERLGQYDKRIGRLNIAVEGVQHGSGSVDNALYAGYRDDPFDSSHQGEHSATQL